MATIKGPKKEIDKIKEILTTPITLSDLSSDFSKELILITPEATQNTILLQKTIEVSGSVVEFSEREFEVELSSKNVPEGYRLKTFPNTISLVCKASIKELKTMNTLDFEVVVDYGAIAGTSSNLIKVKLNRRPQNAYAVQLLTSQVEFVLEKL